MNIILLIAAVLFVLGVIEFGIVLWQALLERVRPHE